MIDANGLRTRHRIEEEFHDTKAREGVNDFYAFGALDEADAHLWQVMGDLRGKHILEIGCGDGTGTLRFVKAGARVTAIDISGEMVELTKRVVGAHSLAQNVDARRMGGEDIDFPEETFDIVYGHSILHHLNLDVAGPRISRVLKRGGMAAFLEPLDYNPVLNLFRRMTPHRRTPTEKPVRWGQLESLAGGFSRWEHQEFYFFSLVAFLWYYGLKNRTLFKSTQKLLQHIDRWLFKLVPPVKKMAWVTVVWFTR